MLCFSDWSDLDVTCKSRVYETHELTITEVSKFVSDGDSNDNL